MMAVKDRITLSSIDQETMTKLQQLALRFLSKRSASALVKYLADHAHIVEDFNDDGELISKTIMISKEAMEH